MVGAPCTSAPVFQGKLSVCLAGAAKCAMGPSCPCQSAWIFMPQVYVYADQQCSTHAPPPRHAVRNVHGPAPC